MSESLRVVIGEDGVLLREGIARLLTEAGFDVVPKPATQRLFCARASHPASVVIADVNMPGHAGRRYAGCDRATTAAA
jgi:DNA-binding NarL/FixJ family response regulator